MPKNFTVNGFTDLIFQIWILFQKLCSMLTNEELWERMHKFSKKKETFNCNLETSHKSACGYMPVHIKHENTCSLEQVASFIWITYSMVLNSWLSVSTR